MSIVQIETYLWMGAFDTSLVGKYNIIMCAPLREEEKWIAHRIHLFRFTDDIQPPSAKEVGIIQDARADASRLCNVLVCCREGKNRSGLIAALAYRDRTGCSGEKAIAHIQSRREGALTNPYFQQILRDLPEIKF
jgi:hypothetical protein